MTEEKAISSKEESYRNALAAIRQETRSDPADLETAVGNLRSIYDITNMALFAGDAGFTSPVETTVESRVTKEDIRVGATLFKAGCHVQTVLSRIYRGLNPMERVTEETSDVRELHERRAAEKGWPTPEKAGEKS